jgi:hypothetical protein
VRTPHRLGPASEGANGSPGGEAPGIPVLAPPLAPSTCIFPGAPWRTVAHYGASSEGDAGSPRESPELIMPGSRFESRPCYSTVCATAMVRRSPLLWHVHVSPHSGSLVAL